MHESMLNESLGKHPPRQYAPTPQKPYDEQQGALDGQGLLESQVIMAWTVDAAATVKAATACIVFMSILLLFFFIVRHWNWCVV
jgi:hypothetical protein